MLTVFLLLGYQANRLELVGDESRYLVYARNILAGFYASNESLMFWNGPGYPLYLAPFVAWKAPLFVPRLGNGFFLFFCVCYFYGSLKYSGINKRALMYAYLLAFIFLMHGALLNLLMCESLSVFLISGLLFHYTRTLNELAWNRKSLIHLVAAGLYLGYLIWTKVFFGFATEVALLLVMGYGILEKVLGRFDAAARRVCLRSAGVGLVAITFCLPYLFYTWAITGKIHFWGNSGGLQLYCLTVPEPELSGDWLNFDMVRDHPEFFPVQAPFFQEMSHLDYIRRDAAFKRAAIDNIRSHPGKFFWNWRANLNRLVFGFPVSPYPGSDTELTTGNRSFAYGLPFLLFFFALIPGWLGRKAIPVSAHFLLIFAGISLGGLSLLSGIPRQVFPLIPLLVFWTVMVVEKAVQWQGIRT